MLEPRPTMKAPIEGEPISPADAMKWAFILARKGAGHVSPNPMVGCVIVDAEHRFVSGGWHAKVGFAHAEIEALDRLAQVKGNREAVAGCHMYVTLEPCAHEGRTPSCAKTLVPLRPASLTFALKDPNPLVAGKGEKVLRDAGIKTVCLSDATAWPAVGDRAIEASVKQELLDEAEDLNEIFLWNMRSQISKGMPFVTVKVASSLDGRVALTNGESKWITCELAREKGHRLRLEHDVIVVGRKTIEADNPSLNVRLEDVSDHSNSVVIVDPKAKLADRLVEFNVAKVRPTTRVFICTQEGIADEKAVARAKDLGFRVFEVPGSKEGVVDLPVMLKKIRDYGMHGVFIEGGAGTVGPFLNQQLAQRLHVFMSTSIIGGRHAVGWSDACGVSELKAAWKLGRQRVKLIGQDLHITGRLDLSST